MVCLLNMECTCSRYECCEISCKGASHIWHMVRVCTPFTCTPHDESKDLTVLRFRMRGVFRICNLISRNRKLANVDSPVVDGAIVRPPTAGELPPIVGCYDLLLTRKAQFQWLKRSYNPKSMWSCLHAQGSRFAHKLW